MIKILDDEIWKTIKEYPDYQISNYGRIKSLKFGKGIIKKLSKDRYGYYQVYFTKNRIKKTFRIHRLVYEYFVGNIPEGYIVHHIDKEPENNYYKNFELMPESEHQKYHLKHRIYSKVSDETKTKMSKIRFTKEQIITILQMINEKILIVWIASLFFCSTYTIENIKFGRTYQKFNLN